MEKVTAIFDIGKTNKKLLLFNEAFRVIYESSDHLIETTDDDGFPCEDIHLLRKWINEKWNELLAQNNFNLTAVNFTSYGATLVHLDKNNIPFAPIYSYLKPYPVSLAEKLYNQYGGKWNFSAATCSPPMGMLNSGLQLYWLKYEKPKFFEKITTPLHLPQYLSFLFSKKKISEYTSIGCHTALWNFTTKNYHQWVIDEGINKLLPSPTSSPVVGRINKDDYSITVGAGLHDSSAALIPYLKKQEEPFLLLSTGTWCITLNPFNHSQLTKEELSQDVLCYMTTEGSPVKASRLFFGREHDYHLERLAEYFGKNINYYNEIQFDDEKIKQLLERNLTITSGNRQLIPQCMKGTGPFPQKPDCVWDMNLFSSYEDAYFQLMLDLTCMLKYSIQLVDTAGTETIFVEGGFGANDLFMQLLANHFPAKNVQASFLQQATALGAAIYINNKSSFDNWNFRNYPPSSLQFSLENYYNGLIKGIKK